MSRECNAAIASQHDEKYEPWELEVMIKEARISYQTLLLCIDDVKKEKGGPDEDDRPAVPRSHDAFLREVIQEEIDDSGYDSDFEEEVLENMDQAMEAEGIDEGQRASKLNKWRKLLALPNVHVGLHLMEVIREFATLMNCSVLACESKHK